MSQARLVLGSGRLRSATSRLFTSSSIVQAKAKTPATKTKSGGFKLKKEQYTGARRIAATKPSALPASQLTGHHLLQTPKRELNLPGLTPETLTARAAGTAVSLPSGPSTVSGAFGLPLSLEDEFSLLSSPTSVIRDVTLSMIDVLDKGEKLGTSVKDSRVVLVGDPGSGKSHLLLQAANYAAAKKWIVLYAPRVTSWVDSTTPYAYDARTRTFQQPELGLQLLEQFVQANSEILRSPDTQIAKEIHNERLGTFAQGTPLSNLLDIGLKDQSLATETLEVALKVLGEQTKHPVLLAIDDFQALFCMSKYRDPQYQLLFAHHLSVPRLILEYAAGTRVLAKGAVLGAVSSTDARFLAPLPLKEALGIVEPGVISPYERRNKDVAHYAAGLKGLRVPSKMQIGEATSMFDIWIKNNALHTPATDSLFMSKYVEASGNPRELNGIRTLSQYHPWYTLKTCEEMLKELGADIICFQEMKISRQLLTKSLALPESYDAAMSFPKNKGGYSGVAVYTNRATVIPLRAEEGLAGGVQSTSKVQLDANQRISVTYPEASTLEMMPDELGNMPSDLVDLDSEGRTLVVDFGLFVLINVYCPNQTSEERLPFKFNFHKLLEDRVQRLMDEGREVIVLGDLNVVATPVDHCEGSLESKKNTFWEPPVRAWFRDWLDPEGPMIDVVRRAWPDREKMFTCWDTRTNARESNYGTRIDYILLTKGLLPWFKHGDIQPDIRGSDHCPVFVDLYDEITLQDGRISRLADVLGPLLDSEGKCRDPPPISTKYWDEYSGKQKLLSTFFAKKAVLSSSELTSTVTEPLVAKPTSEQEELAPSPVSLTSPATQESPSMLGQNNIPSPKPEGRKRKTASSTTEISNMDSKKSKKSQAANRGNKQHKLSTFFPASHGSLAKQPSSPPIELLDSEDEIDSPQTIEVPSSAEISTALPASQVKDGKSSKDAWSQLMRPTEAPNCTVHNVPTKEYTVNKPGPNKGKKFFVCSMPMGPGYDSGKTTRLREEVDPRYRCNYFKWANDVRREAKHGG